MVSMNMAARNHCSRSIARGLHGHNGCSETSPKALSRLNSQVEDSEKFGLRPARTRWRIMLRSNSEKCSGDLKHEPPGRRGRVDRLLIEVSAVGGGSHPPAHSLA